MDRPSNPPAFPRRALWLETEQTHTLYDESQTGMSLRDYFAGKALQGFAKNYWRDAEVAERCYELADAMLVAREKGGTDAS